MGIIIRQSLKSTLASYAGVMLGALNIMVLFPRYFEDSQFGLTRVLLAVATLVAQFGEFGGSNMINRFFPFFKEDRHTLRRFITWILAMALVFCTFLALAIYIFRAPILEHYEERGSVLIADFYGFVFPLIVFILIFNLLEAYARSLMRVAVPTFLREIYVRLFQLAGIILFILKLIDFNEFMVLFAASYGTAMLVILGYVFWLDRSFISANLSFRKHEMMKEIMIYGLFSITTTGVWRAIFLLDVIMLSYLGYEKALAGVAVYSIAAYIVTFMQMPQRSLTQISIPIISHAIKQENWQEVKELYQRVGLNQFIMGVFLFLCVWANLGCLYHFLPEAYRNMEAIILLLAIGRLFDMSTGFNGEIIAYSKYFRFNFWSGILLIIFGIGTNFIFISKYGILGAAIATALTLIFINVIRIVFLFFKKGFLPFSKEMIVVTIIAVIIMGLAYLMPQVANVYLNFIARSAMVVIVFFSFLFGLNVSKDIKDTSLNLFNRFRKMIG